MSIDAPSRVLLTGPAAPRDLAHLFSRADSLRAESVEVSGGVPVTELADSLVNRGLAVEVVTTAPVMDSIEVFDGPHIRLTVVPMRARARARAKDAFRLERAALRRVISESSADVVHAHWTYEYALAALATQHPVVVTAHDAPLTVLRHLRDPYRLARTAMAYLTRLRLRSLTAVSPYLADQWRRQMAYRRDIDVIPNSVPTLSAGDASLRQGGDTPSRIVDVADAGPIKNLGKLVQAFQIVKARGRNVTLELIGPGLGAGDDFASAISDRGLAEGVTFTGPVDRAAIGESLARASLFVHPSLEECCPMAVLEAMGAGVPVIAGAEAGGTPWVLGSGDAGLLLNISDEQDIAAGIEQLLDDSVAAERLIDEARRRVAEVFSRDAVTSGYLDVYCRAVADR